MLFVRFRRFKVLLNVECVFLSVSLSFSVFHLSSLSRLPKKYSELLLSTVRQKVERRGRGRVVKEEEEWREKEENGKEEGKCLLVSPFFFLEGLAGRV